MFLISYKKLITPLIKAVQELYFNNIKLSERINNLEKKYKID